MEHSSPTQSDGFERKGRQLARTTQEREREKPQKPTAASTKNARISANRRRKRPLPATREEAEELYRPRAGGNERAIVTGPRLCRLAELGLLEIRSAPGPSITNLDAHRAILDFYYPMPVRGADD